MTKFFDVPDGVTLFDTAEEAALAEWAHTPAAHARVVEVRPSVDATAVWVVLQLGEPTGFHDQDIVTCVCTPEGRWWTSGSTGASSGGVAAPTVETVPRACSGTYRRDGAAGM